MAGSEPRSLRRSITLREGVFMYVGSVLGSGILVAPAIAASIAGPASLVAWILLSLLSYPIGYTFGVLASTYPDAGGVSAYVKRAFGWAAGTVAGWLFVFSYFVGAPIVSIIASSYIITSLGLSANLLYPVAFMFMGVAILSNVAGIRVSSRTETVVLASILLLLFVGVSLTLPHVEQANFMPFAPKGWIPVGVVAVIIFWSFQGYENVPHMAEEFRNPKRDFTLSIALSVVITSLLYVLTALVTIGTGIYKNQSLYAPIAIMFSRSLGVSATLVTLFLAVTTCFGVMNAYSIGVSRLVYALARDASMPRMLAMLNKNAVPSRAVFLLFTGAATGLSVIMLLGAQIEPLFLISGAGFTVLYIMGSAASVKLLKLTGLKRIFPYLTLAVSLIVFVFVGEYVLFPVTIAGLSALWILGKTRVRHRS